MANCCCGSQPGNRLAWDDQAKLFSVVAQAQVLFDGAHHYQPLDVQLDSRGRIWFADPYNAQASYGPPAVISPGGTILETHPSPAATCRCAARSATTG